MLGLAKRWGISLKGRVNQRKAKKVSLKGFNSKAGLGGRFFALFQGTQRELGKGGCFKRTLFQKAQPT